MKEDKKQNDQIDIPKISADFQCFVCGAIFTTDEDRKRHLEKEAHCQLRDDETTEEKELSKKQEELDESHPHHILNEPLQLPNMEIAQEEVFGPVAPIITVDDEKEAIRIFF